MNKIPEEIMMHAERLYEEGGYKTVPQIIAEAILAERITYRWQTIETAPKDGTHVLLYCDYYGVGRCAWESWRGIWRSDDPSHGIGFPDPTHWMPLPPYPIGSKRETQTYEWVCNSTRAISGTATAAPEKQEGGTNE